MLLRRLADGDGGARVRLVELLYGELRALAAAQLRGTRGETLRPTALVHEAWLRLAGADDFSDRRHFFAVAAKAMRSVLVDHVRAKRTQKRGGGEEASPLDETVAFLEGNDTDLLDLNDALAELEREDAELARLVELRFFGGLSHEEIAGAEGTSLSTIERRWRLARAWLARRLGGGAPR